MLIVLANGNPTNIGHKWEARSNHWTLFFNNLCLFKDSMKRPFGISKGLA